MNRNYQLHMRKPSEMIRSIETIQFDDEIKQLTLRAKITIHFTVFGKLLTVNIMWSFKGSPCLFRNTHTSNRYFQYLCGWIYYTGSLYCFYGCLWVELGGAENLNSSWPCVSVINYSKYILNERYIIQAKYFHPVVYSALYLFIVNLI